MQKRAARRGVRALAFLLCLLMVVSLLPVMGANAAEGGNEVGKDAPDVVSTNPVLDKFLTEDANGNYTLTLTAYATGTTTTVHEKSGKPLDIVLVLDQSGSMKSNNYVQPLKDAVTNFVNSISQNAKDYNVEHRVALVGYASRYDSSSRWANTGLFINGSLYNYQKAGSSTKTSRLTAENYKSALVSVNDANGNVTSSITTAISKISGNGATYTNYGMEMANGVFANNPIEAGSDRQRIVVVFTDGQPGQSGYDSSIATAAVKEAYTTKNTYNAKVYTVGLYSSASTNVKNFMNYLSSNYPKAQSMTQAGNRDATKYYMTTSNSAELGKIFEQITQDIQHPTTDVTLNANAELRDTISDLFDVKEDSTITVQTVAGTYRSNSEPAWGESTQVSQTSFPGKNIGVTGFDYSNEYIADGHPGKKLVVTVTGLIPKDGGEKLLSNNDGAGIYESVSATTPAAEFPKPWTNIPVYTKVLDFSMTANIATNVKQTSGALAGTYGTFTGSNNSLTYKLGKTVASGNLVFDGVDSVLFYGDYNDDGNDTTARWNKVNVIPANNVYFDDDLLNSSSTFTDGDQGYDAAVPKTTNTMTVEGGTSKTFTFTGTGIDVYCTTENTSGWVTARLSKMVDGKDTYVDGAIMKNEYVSAPPLYNVPTLSFTGLDYGTYTLTINTDNNSNYKLDGVRIYNLAQGNSEVTSKYAADEANATFTQVRQILLNDQKSFSVDKEVTGAVYVDEHHEGADLATYEKEGPKNEVYLDKGDAIAFTVKNYQPGQKVMVGLSAPEAGNGSVYLTKNENRTSQEIKSVIDEYYEVIPDANGNVVIENAGTSLISVTNVKVSGTGASSASFEVSPQLMSYVASFDTLNVVQPEPEPTPDPEPTVNNNTVSAIIRAIWTQVMDGIGKLFGRL